MNRGNGKADVFHKRQDYEAFLEMLAEANKRYDMRLVGYCLMSNHFHLVLWPREDGDLSLYMQWLLTTHVRRYHRHYDSSGHVWQGRFKAFPIQRDGHYLTVLRYVEQNAMTAGIVGRASDYCWSSLVGRGLKGGRQCTDGFLEDGECGGDVAVQSQSPLVSLGPVELPSNWLALVNQQQGASDVEDIRLCVQRGRPYGGERWQKLAAKRLGIESSIRPRGRPRKGVKK